MFSLRTYTFDIISRSFKMYHNSSSSMPKNQLKKIFHVTEYKALEVARESLITGEVIALPTDTVYGLSCDANNEQSIQKLYSIKGRDFHKPVAICVKDFNSLRRWGNAEHLDDALLKRLLPGPITIVIERSENLNNRFLNPSTTKIGIRIPDFQFIQKLCESFDRPLALSSANRSSEKSSLKITEFQKLWPHLGAIFDSGKVGITEESRLASTVIDLSIPGNYKIIREGVALKTTLNTMEMFHFKPLLKKCI